jgi:hypothetical protein
VQTLAASDALRWLEKDPAKHRNPRARIWPLKDGLGLLKKGLGLL